jgi:hypothetical protein
MWLEDQLWPKLRQAFPDLVYLPEHALITVGYPSSGARGRSDKIRPAEINRQWTGNQNEQVFISIHPVYFDSPINIAKALVFQGMKHTRGARWGASHAGLEKHDDGTIEASALCQAKLDEVLKDVGEPPSGHGIAFPVRTVSRARLLKYIPSYWSCSDSTRHPVIRAASTTLDVKCTKCGAAYAQVSQ